MHLCARGICRVRGVGLPSSPRVPAPDQMCPCSNTGYHTRKCEFWLKSLQTRSSSSHRNTLQLRSWLRGREGIPAEEKSGWKR